MIARPMAFLLAAASLAIMPCAGSALASPPDEPMVLDDIPEIGKPGGELRTLIGRSKDVRLLYVYGHARLVAYDPQLELIPDIAADYSVEEGRIFTFRLRDGHRWSDGEPLTSEDFRFYFEDVASDPELNPTGLPIDLVIDGEQPIFEIIDERSFRYSWSKPNPYFLPAIAAASPLFIYRPAHYLKAFHKKHIDEETLNTLVREDNARDWVQLFLRRDRMNKFDNPDLPTLQPWALKTPAPAERFVAERNPYFHRVDSKGQQLPYIDRVIMEVVDNKLVPVKTGAGETDLQTRGLSFQDYTFLKENEEHSGLKVNLWKEARGAHLALYPNLNAADPVWRALFRDHRFREALSITLDRHAISQYLYFGLATPANNTILPESPLHTPEIGEACLGHDVERANALLDEIGLTERDAEGLRKLADGRSLEFIVETAGEDSEQTDILELVRDDWADIGLRIHTKPSEREVLRNRIFAGEALMSIWYGLENGVPTARMSPKEFVPVNQYDQPQWPKWGQYFETKGAAGEAPDLVEAQKLMELFHIWESASGDDDRRKAWEEILKIYSSQCYTIGLVANVLQPVASRNSLRNLPAEAVYNWEPHGQIGLYRPDTFWFAD